MKEFAPVTPGDMPKEGFLTENILWQNHVRATGISESQIAEIINHRRQIFADTALGFGLNFDNTPEFWLNLHTHYDLKMARKNRIGAAGSLKEWCQDCDRSSGMGMPLASRGSGRPKARLLAIGPFIK